jgi:hypothetical protein
MPFILCFTVLASVGLGVFAAYVAVFEMFFTFSRPAQRIRPRRRRSWFPRRFKPAAIRRLTRKQPASAVSKSRPDRKHIAFRSRFWRLVELRETLPALCHRYRRTFPNCHSS